MTDDFGFIPEASIPPAAKFVEEWVPDEERQPRFQAVMFDMERFSADGDNDRDAFSLVNFRDGGLEVIPFKDIDERSKYYQQLRSFCFPTRTLEETIRAAQAIAGFENLVEPRALKPEYQQNYLKMRKKRY